MGQLPGIRHAASTRINHQRRRCADDAPGAVGNEDRIQPLIIGADMGEQQCVLVGAGNVGAIEPPLVKDTTGVGQDHAERSQFTGHDDLKLRLAEDLWERGGFRSLGQQIPGAIEKELRIVAVDDSGE